MAFSVSLLYEDFIRFLQGRMPLQPILRRDVSGIQPLALQVTGMVVPLRVLSREPGCAPPAQARLTCS